VCVIDYFGREWGKNIKHASQQQEAWVLEDASQALLTDGLGQNADFVLYSPRKFIGVPDGGILIDRRSVFGTSPELERPPADWWIPQLNAWVRRGQFDREGANSEDRSWYRLYREAKKNAPSKPCSMSKLSRRLIDGAFEYPTISEKRRQNYKFLADNTEYSSILGALEKKEVPVGFVVRSESEEERSEVKEMLIDEHIYPPIHWNLENHVPKKYKKSHVLSEEILTIPCDQRYSIEDMNRILCVIKN
jgi:dTDP-4-amino-4,6-dideoxygalactose transaminase